MMHDANDHADDSGWRTVMLIMMTMMIMGAADAAASAEYADDYVCVKND